MLSSSAPATTAPTTRRLLGPDLARGVMLLLIAMAYASVYVESAFGVDASEQPLLDRVATFASALLLDNRAFPMFAILFGYGLAWSVGRRRDRGSADRDIRRTLRRRALLLLLLGSLHAVLVYPGEILAAYGLGLLLTGWLLFRSDRALIAAIAVTGAYYVLVIPFLMTVAAMAPDDSYGQAAPGYATAGDWIERLVGLPINPVFIALAYPLLVLMLLGYWAGRARLFERAVERRRLLTAIAVGGVAISLLGALPSALMTSGALPLFPTLLGLAMGVQILTGIAGGAGYAAIFALGADRLGRLLPRATGAVAAMGRRSLTFYVLTSILVAAVLQPDLVGVGPHVGIFGALVVAACCWIVSLMLAVALERAGRPGPLEALMRRGVYGRTG